MTELEGIIKNIIKTMVFSILIDEKDIEATPQDLIRFLEKYDD